MISRLMLSALAVLLATGIEYKHPDPQYCPPAIIDDVATGSIGYVQIIKDGYLVAGGKARYDSRSGVLTAWFPSDRYLAFVVMTLKFSPDLRLHTSGIGSVRMHHGTFCAYPPPRPKDSSP